jgi:hypothetical protein
MPISPPSSSHSHWFEPLSIVPQKKDEKSTLSWAAAFVSDQTPADWNKFSFRNPKHFSSPISRSADRCDSPIPKEFLPESLFDSQHDVKNPPPVESPALELLPVVSETCLTEEPPPPLRSSLPLPHATLEIKMDNVPVPKMTLTKSPLADLVQFQFKKVMRGLVQGKSLETIAEEDIFDRNTAASPLSSSQTPMSSSSPISLASPENSTVGIPSPKAPSVLGKRTIEQISPNAKRQAPTYSLPFGHKIAPAQKAALEKAIAAVTSNEMTPLDACETFSTGDVDISIGRLNYHLTRYRRSQPSRI